MLFAPEGTTTQGKVLRAEGFPELVNVSPPIQSV
jgi:hypothetical protein